MEKVSVIIPVYNKFDKLFSAIDSALSQDYPELEIIVSDDGSKDFPFRKVEEYILEKKQDHLFNYEIIANKKNMGTVRNMNGAIKASHGDILINLAGDDRFCEKNTVSKIVRSMNLSGYDNLVCRRKTEDNKYIPSDSEIRRINKNNTAQKQNIAFIRGYFWNMASGSVLALRRNFIYKMGLYDDRYILWEDGPLFYKITRKGIKINTDYSIVSVIYSEEGISNIPNKKMKSDEKRFLKVLLKDNNINIRNKKIIKYRLIRKFIYEKYNYKQKIKFFIRFFDTIIIRTIVYLKVKRR